MSVNHHIKEIISENFYRHLFEGCGIAIVATDITGMINAVNNQAREVFRDSLEQMPENHIRYLLPEKYYYWVDKAIEAARSELKVSELEFDYVYQENNLNMLIRLSAVRDDQDQVCGLAGWIMDITRRTQLKQQLLQAEKAASLGTLAAGVAHHFNNIMGGVSTFVDFAKSSHNPTAMGKALDMTAQAANRISKITGSLLTFAEKDIRQFDLADLTEVVLSFVNNAEEKLPANNIELTVDINPIPVFEVPGPKIYEVLKNLQENSVKAMPDGGKIKIGLRQNEDNIVLSFSDNGKGIASYNIPHIFDPFFTTDAVEWGGNCCQSSGLGLAVVQGIVRELGGDIQAKSVLGKGTTFKLLFPLTRK